MERKRMDLERHVNELLARKLTMENEQFQKNEQLSNLQNHNYTIDHEVKNTQLKIGTYIYIFIFIR